MSFEILVLGVSQRRLEVLAIRNIPLYFVGMGRTDHLFWLIGKSLGHFLMHPLHFRMRDGWQLVIAGLVRGDLRSSSPLDTLLFEVGLNLLTSGARGIQVFARVA